MQVISGAASDATVTITAGVDKDAKLVLKDSASGANGATFELLNDGSENVYPTFKITDGKNTMLSVTDKGEIGDLYVSGSATFGGPVPARGPILPSFLALAGACLGCVRARIWVLASPDALETRTDSCF